MEAEDPSDDRRLRNRRGDPIDAVPFAVCVGLGFMFTMSLGPLYGLAYGLSLTQSIGVSALGFCAVSVVAYRQLVRSAPPIDAGSLPVRPRFARLVYAGVGFAVVLIALTVPLI